MEKVICNAPRGKAKTSRFACVVALIRKVATSATLPVVLALAVAAGTAFADTAINLANSLSTVEGVYTVEGTVVTLVKTNETYNLSGVREGMRLDNVPARNGGRELHHHDSPRGTPGPQQGAACRVVRAARKRHVRAGRGESPSHEVPHRRERGRYLRRQERPRRHRSIN